MADDLYHYGASELSAEDRRVIIHLARELTGTIVTHERHGLIFLNVTNRLSETGCQSLTDYLKYVHHHEQEVAYLLSALTIHTTGWFREPMTFDQFQNIVLEFVRKNPNGTFKLLSLGCSSGEEVYSYAFVLEDIRRTHPGFAFHLTGVDIDPISLQQGRRAVYSKVRLDFVEERWRHLLTRRMTSDDTLRIEPSLSSLVNFRSTNILHIESTSEEFDFISCRNILIYFDPVQINSIIGKVVHMLRPSGYFCTGVSETGAVMRPEFRSHGSTIFQINKNGVAAVGTQTRVSIQPVKDESQIDTVIMVDDDTELLSVYEASLRKEFKSVTVAGRYEDALVKLSQSPKAFLVIDYQLEAMRTGLDLVREARNRGFRGDFILLSGLADTDIAVKAHELGCKDVILKPCGLDELIAAIKRYGMASMSAKPLVVLPELLAFGSSTGGTEILIKILEKVPQPCPPVVVVQHIVPEFAADFAKRLAEKSGLTLGKMVDGEVLRPNHLYMSLGDYHIMVRKSGGVLRLGLSHGEPVASHRPSVDFLFESLANHKIRTVAVILTGMGRDGADGMAKIHARGGYTMAQDESSSIVFGMPGEAIKLGAVDLIGNPRQIQLKIHDILGVNKRLAS